MKLNCIIVHKWLKQLVLFVYEHEQFVFMLPIIINSEYASLVRIQEIKNKQKAGIWLRWETSNAAVKATTKAFEAIQYLLKSDTNGIWNPDSNPAG